MNLADIVQLGGLVVALVVGFWNMRNNASLSVPVNMRNMNEAIKLANDRALDAEKRALAAEEAVSLLEKRTKLLESTMAYRLTFDVILGHDPKVERVEIQHFPERRKKDNDVIIERRRVK
jgi:hypothetical protein